MEEYIRKRRLSQSAIELLASEKRIIEIAMEFGCLNQGMRSLNRILKK
ncbi:AraC-like DNA-binding protein [Fontibacillus solani]|uniref:AraC-like DNA-binding protein n=1 Tax=Fontibacillus solani TaxID=1572857 RepID=A0A7W3XPV5_9BACL|nr:hypothetical protein [Fontibacillus solani]MBA9083854.1 AraC-like DNA-binding protein [Fontibacillus solani]